MNYRQRKQMEIDKRCKKLKDLGFEIRNEDSNVLVYMDSKTRHKVIVDFSSISEDMFLFYALQKTYEEGREFGRTNLQMELRDLLGAKKEEEY